MSSYIHGSVPRRSEYMLVEVYRARLKGSRLQTFTAIRVSEPDERYRAEGRVNIFVSAQLALSPADHLRTVTAAPGMLTCIITNCHDWMLLSLPQVESFLATAIMHAVYHPC